MLLVYVVISVVLVRVWARAFYGLMVLRNAFVNSTDVALDIRMWWCSVVGVTLVRLILLVAIFYVDVVCLVLVCVTLV